MDLKVNIPERVEQIIGIFKEAHFEIYIVGGAVRDLMLGKLIYDWDFTTNATPETMLKLFSDAYYTNEYGMVGVPSESGRPYEITTYRTEHGYSDSRRPDKIEWGKSLEEDLQRRDFTINAMALQLAAAEQKTENREQRTDSNTKSRSLSTDNRSTPFSLIDPFHGQKDLERKLIRAVGDPNERFAEDALRMMRAVRIAAELDFTVEENTLSAIKSNSKSIQNISKERVRDELLKMLASAHPYEGVLLLKESLLLEQILPELEKTFGVEQKSPGRHHVYDVGTHSLMSLKNCPSTDPVVRFACLIHDIGKPLTYKKLENGTITFYNHEMVSTKIAARIADRLHFSNKQKDKLVKLVRWHQFTVDERQTDSAIRRFIKNVGLENVTDMLDLRVGDRLGGGARETSWRLEEFKKRLIEVQKQPFSIKDLKISGTDVMDQLKIPPGPKVGEMLNKLFDEVTEKGLENDRKVLLKRLKENA